MNKCIPIVTLMALLVSCASTETVAYKTLATTVVSVDAAMNGWGEYVRAGKASDDEQALIRDLYTKYQSSLKSAKAAVDAYYANRVNKTGLDLALNILDESKNQLIDTIFIIKQ